MNPILHLDPLTRLDTFRLNSLFSGHSGIIGIGLPKTNPYTRFVLDKGKALVHHIVVLSKIPRDLRHSLTSAYLLECKLPH
jgi:hypothetical protein